jgi:flagellar biosynthetic protein FliQ
VNSSEVLSIAVQALWVAAKLCAPILLTALIIGFAVSLLQSITQVQEATLAFVPKAVGVALALLLAGHWMITEIVTFTHELFDKIPLLLKG